MEANLVRVTFFGTIAWTLVGLMTFGVFAASAEECSKDLAGAPAAVMEIARLVHRKATTSDRGLRSVLVANIEKKEREFEASFGRSIAPGEISAVLPEIEKADLEGAESLRGKHQSEADAMKWQLQMRLLKDSLLPPGYQVDEKTDVARTADGRFNVVAKVQDDQGKKGIYVFDLGEPDKGRFIEARAHALYSGPSESAVVVLQDHFISVFDPKTRLFTASFDVLQFPGYPKQIALTYRGVGLDVFSGSDGKPQIVVNIGMYKEIFLLNPVSKDVRKIEHEWEYSRIYVSPDRRSVYAYGLGDDRLQAGVVDVLNNKVILRAPLDHDKHSISASGLALHQSHDGRLFLSANFSREKMIDIWDVRAQRLMAFAKKDPWASSTGGVFLENQAGQVFYLPEQEMGNQMVIELTKETITSFSSNPRDFHHVAFFSPLDASMIYIDCMYEPAHLVKASVTAGLEEETGTNGFAASDLLATGSTVRGVVFGLFKTPTGNLSLIQLYGPSEAAVAGAN